MTAQEAVIQLNKMSMTTAQKWIHIFCCLGERDLQWQLGVYLSGDHNKKLRQEIMSELNGGVKVPIAKSGITAIQSTIMESELWQLGEKLRAIGMEDCQDYAVQVDKGNWCMMRFFWMHPEKGFCPHFQHAIDWFFILTHRNNITFKDRNNVIHNF